MYLQKVRSGIITSGACISILCTYMYIMYILHLVFIDYIYNFITAISLMLSPESYMLSVAPIRINNYFYFYASDKI